MNRQCLTLHCHCRSYIFGRTWPTRTCSSHNFCTCRPDLRLFGWCAGNWLIYVHAFNAPELVEIECTVWNAINLDGLKRKKKCVWRVYLNHSTVIEFHCIKVYERKSHRDCFTHRFIFMCFQRVQMNEWNEHCTGTPFYVAAPQFYRPQYTTICLDACKCITPIRILLYNSWIG